MILLLILLIIIIICINIYKSAGIDTIYPIYTIKDKLYFKITGPSPFKEPIKKIYKRVLSGNLELPDIKNKIPFMRPYYNNFYVAFILSNFISILNFLKNKDKKIKIVAVSTLAHSIIFNILADWYDYEIYLFNPKPNIYYLSKKIKYFNKFPSDKDFIEFQGCYFINNIYIIGPLPTTFYKSNASRFGIEYHNILLEKFKPIESISFLTGIYNTCLLKFPVGRVEYQPFSYNGSTGYFVLRTQYPIRFKTIDISEITHKAIAFNYYIRNIGDSIDMEIYNKLNKYDKEIIKKYICDLSGPRKKKVNIIEYADEYFKINPEYYNKIFDRYYFMRRRVYDHHMRYNKNKYLLPHFKNRDYNNPSPIIKNYKGNIDICCEYNLFTMQRVFSEYYTFYNFSFKNKYNKLLEPLFKRNSVSEEFIIDDDFDNFLIIKTIYQKFLVHQKLLEIYDYIILPNIIGLYILFELLVPTTKLVSNINEIKKKEKNIKILIWEIGLNNKFI